jgi:hypothetical protein
MDLTFLTDAQKEMEMSSIDMQGNASELCHLIHECLSILSLCDIIHDESSETHVMFCDIFSQVIRIVDGQTNKIMNNQSITEDSETVGISINTSRNEEEGQQRLWIETMSLLSDLIALLPLFDVDVSDESNDQHHHQQQRGQQSLSKSLCELIDYLLIEKQVLRFYLDRFGQVLLLTSRVNTIENHNTVSSGGNTNKRSRRTSTSNHKKSNKASTNDDDVVVMIARMISSLELIMEQVLTLCRVLQQVVNNSMISRSQRSLLAVSSVTFPYIHWRDCIQNVLMMLDSSSLAASSASSSSSAAANIGFETFIVRMRQELSQTIQVLNTLLDPSLTCDLTSSGTHVVVDQNPHMRGTETEHDFLMCFQLDELESDGHVFNPS